jgi:anaerobic selenocysteine-containing dehydrogenase
VINLLRKHVDRYTPELVSRICGTPQDKYLQVCDLLLGSRSKFQGDAFSGKITEASADISAAALLCSSRPGLAILDEEPA